MRSREKGSRQLRASTKSHYKPECDRRANILRITRKVKPPVTSPNLTHYRMQAISVAGIDFLLETMRN